MNWIRLDECSVVGSRQLTALAVRADTILAFGTTEDGMSWVRTPVCEHKVTAGFNELAEMIFAQEWATDERGPNAEEGS